MPLDERERFLNEYQAALDNAHNVQRYPELQELLIRWTATVTGLGGSTSLGDTTPKRCAW